MNNANLTSNKPSEEKVLTIEFPKLDIKSIIVLREIMNTFLLNLDSRYFDEILDYYGSAHSDLEEPF